MEKRLQNIPSEEIKIAHAWKGFPFMPEGVAVCLSKLQHLSDCRNWDGAD